MKSIIGLLSALLLSLIAQTACATERPQYLFAVLPQRPPVAMHANWRPFLDALEREAGVTFKLKLYETMPQFEDEMKRGEADFIFSTPPHVVLARQSQHYQPLVRGSRTIAGVLFSKKGSGVKNVADLDNKEVAFIGSRNV